MVKLESVARGGVMTMTPGENLGFVFLLSSVCVLVWVAKSAGVALGRRGSRVSLVRRGLDGSSTAKSESSAREEVMTMTL